MRGDDVARIASRFDVEATVLAEAVRRADALSQLQHKASSARGFLMAARDREGNELNLDGASVEPS
jgi:hypothetical protein